MDTTRRYPRTLAEAFPSDRAPAIERPAPGQWREVAVEAALWAGMAVVFTAPFWWHLVARRIGGAA